MKTKMFLFALAALILTCLFPPWLYTFDAQATHSRKPAGYSLLFSPPTNPDSTGEDARFFGVQLDFGRLFIEWIALAAMTGTGWLLVVKPAWLRDGNTNRPQNFTPPSGNPRN